ncbi:aldo/keto reductase [Saccharibacillus sp. O16]|nr:aldo/keto reductase [Saccharibacillus sp. O16]
MEKVTLGQQGLKVSRLGLGCMGMSEFYGEQDDQESLRTLDAAFEQGIRFYDTADMYANGKNEEFIAPFIQKHRNDVVIATKFGNVRGEDGSYLGISGRPEYVREACDKSLKRLGVDVIDLYYQHRVDPNVPIEETIGAMSDLVREGKVRYLGMSEASPETIRRAHTVFPISALQTEYSLWSRDVEDEILPLCRELGIGFVPYSPLGRGFLTGQIRSFDDLAQDDFRRFSPRFQGENFQKNLNLVDRIREIAAKKGCMPSQLALSWLLAQGEDIVPIPGTKKVKYLTENIGAVQVSLTDEELKQIDAVAPKGAAAGDRYEQNGMRTLNH